MDRGGSRMYSDRSQGRYVDGGRGGIGSRTPGESVERGDQINRDYRFENPRLRGFGVERENSRVRRSSKGYTIDQTRGRYRDDRSVYSRERRDDLSVYPRSAASGNIPSRGYSGVDRTFSERVMNGYSGRESSGDPNDFRRDGLGRDYGSTLSRTPDNVDYIRRPSRDYGSVERGLDPLFNTTHGGSARESYISSVPTNRILSGYDIYPGSGTRIVAWDERGRPWDGSGWDRSEDTLDGRWGHGEFQKTWSTADAYHTANRDRFDQTEREPYDQYEQFDRYGPSPVLQRDRVIERDRFDRPLPRGAYDQYEQLDRYGALSLVSRDHPVSRERFDRPIEKGAYDQYEQLERYGPSLVLPRDRLANTDRIDRPTEREPYDQYERLDRYGPPPIPPQDRYEEDRRIEKMNLRPPPELLSAGDLRARERDEERLYENGNYGRPADRLLEPPSRLNEWDVSTVARPTYTEIRSLYLTRWSKYDPRGAPLMDPDPDDNGSRHWGTEFNDESMDGFAHPEYQLRPLYAPRSPEPKRVRASERRARRYGEWRRMSDSTPVKRDSDVSMESHPVRKVLRT